MVSSQGSHANFNWATSSFTTSLALGMIFSSRAGEKSSWHLVF
jgi:hypothetical protein